MKKLVAVIPLKVGRKHAELLLSESRIYGKALPVPNHDCKQPLACRVCADAVLGTHLGFRLPDYAFDVERAEICEIVQTRRQGRRER